MKLENQIQKVKELSSERGVLIRLLTVENRKVDSDGLYMHCLRKDIKLLSKRIDRFRKIIESKQQEQQRIEDSKILDYSKERSETLVGW